MKEKLTSELKAINKLVKSRRKKLKKLAKQQDLIRESLSRLYAKEEIIKVKINELEQQERTTLEETLKQKAKPAPEPIDDELAALIDSL